MIKTAITTVLLAATISATPAPAPKAETVWEDGGEWRITNYCNYCNDPVGHQSSSGRYLEYGQVAMNGVPIGTEICIDGEIFEVTDRCGINNTVDIYVESGDGCHCNKLEYKKVYIKRKEGEIEQFKDKNQNSRIGA